ncbi:SOS response-associated peptidase [Roseomonas sp. BN140053]|uniref:SOS response-associated peptidase n=1 Tax=Roseomonas sp. BN140053 TaxID=3391898 RepID=UPI0039E77B4F
MCGRYILQREPHVLANHFETTNAIPNYAPNYNVAPTQDGLVVRRHPESGARSLDQLRWGLVPRWAKDASGGARLINARADGVADKPSFRDAFTRRRCLVPADGFFEWRQEEPGPKQPYAIALRSGEPMALAGLWEGWKQPDGTWLRTYSIITTDANQRMSALHHRMPVILPREHWPAWLGEAEAGRDDLLGLLRPCPEDWLAVWPVDKRVNRVAENDPSLLARAPRPPGDDLDDPPALHPAGSGGSGGPDRGQGGSAPLEPPPGA